MMHCIQVPRLFSTAGFFYARNDRFLGSSCRAATTRAPFRRASVTWQIERYGGFRSALSGGLAAARPTLPGLSEDKMLGANARHLEPLALTLTSHNHISHRAIQKPESARQSLLS